MFFMKALTQSAQSHSSYAVMANGCAIDALRMNLEMFGSKQKVKFKWNGDLDLLKLFVQKILNLSGEWTFISNNGGYHLFRSKEVSESIVDETIGSMHVG